MESVTQTDRNLEGMCRACLEKTSTISLFDAIYDEGKTFNLWEVFECCSDIQVDEDDELPKAVCDDCLSEMVTVYHFVEKVKSSDAVLRSLNNDNKHRIQLFDDCRNGNINVSETFSNALDSKNLAEQTVKTECDAVSVKAVFTDAKDVPIISDDDFDYIVESNVGSLETESEMTVETLMKPITEDDSVNDKLQSHPELFTTNNIKISHIDPKIKNKRRNYDKRRAWKERNKNKFHCNICLKPFYSHSRLTEHVRSHTKEKPYKCDICPAAFTLICNLTRHNRQHTGEKPFTCKLCNKGFTRLLSLNTHSRLHADEKPYLCRCGQSFHHNTSCPSSARTYSIDSNGEKIKCPVLCKDCGTIYTEECRSNNHIASRNDAKRFLCSICGKEYVSKIGLQHHNLTHTGERPYKCDMCTKSFKNMNSLKTHHLIHTGERPYVCNICGKCFVQRSHLWYHMMEHAGVKKYTCKFCSKAFIRNGNLTQHLMTHTDEMPFECSFCGKGFRTSSSLKKHKKVHVKVINDEINQEL